MLEEEEKRKTLRLNPSEFIKQKMQKSLSQPKLFNQQLDFDDNKKKKEFKKKIFKKDKKKLKRNESDIKSDHNMGKEALRLDAYNDVNTIIDFIDNSKSNSQSKYYRGHFTNILATKNINETMQHIMLKNNLICK